MMGPPPNSLARPEAQNPPGTIQSTSIHGAPIMSAVPLKPGMQGMVPPGMGTQRMVPPGMGTQGMVPPGMGTQGMVPPGMGTQGMVPPVTNVGGPPGVPPGGQSLVPHGPPGSQPVGGPLGGLQPPGPPAPKMDPENMPNPVSCVVAMVT